MNIIKELIEKIDSKIIKLPEAKCRNCCQYIFNTETRFGEIGLCVYCYGTYKEGRESILDKYPEQIQIECQNCKNIMTCRDRGIEIFNTNKIALCCDNPDYQYYIKDV